MPAFHAACIGRPPADPSVLSHGNSRGVDGTLAAPLKGQDYGQFHILARRSGKGFGRVGRGLCERHTALWSSGGKRPRAAPGRRAAQIVGRCRLKRQGCTAPRSIRSSISAGRTPPVWRDSVMEWRLHLGSSRCAQVHACSGGDRDWTSRLWHAVAILSADAHPAMSASASLAPTMKSMNSRVFGSW